MEDRDLRDVISELEERFERLAESLERSRKIMLASKMSVIFGGMLMLAGILKLGPMAMIVGTTAIIGGIVLFGSTTTTAKQTSAEMKDAEALRSS
jgi:hypothetical protein